MERSDGRRTNNPTPKFSVEAAKRAASKLAKLFPIKKQIGIGVALSVNRCVVIDRNLLVESGASYNIIVRDELTADEMFSVRKHHPITLTAATQVM